METGASFQVAGLSLRKRRGTGYTEQLQQYSSPGGKRGRGKGTRVGGFGSGFLPGKVEGSPPHHLLEVRGHVWVSEHPTLQHTLTAYSTQ